MEVYFEVENYMSELPILFFTKKSQVFILSMFFEQF